MPRQWSTHWPMPDGTVPSEDQTYSALFTSTEDDTPVGRIVRRNRLKDSFGNRTLLTKPLNSSVSNGPYAGKRTALQDHSLLVMNREITAHDTSHEEAIIARGKSLCTLAKSIWKMSKITYPISPSPMVSPMKPICAT